MIIKFFSAAMILASASLLQADPKCLEDYEFVVEYIEANLPAFVSDISAANHAEYKKLKRTVRKNARRTSSRSGCAKALVYYVEFFRDSHTLLRVGGNTEIDENDVDQVAGFLSSALFNERETIRVRKKHLEVKYPLDDVRGIYESLQSKVKVLVFPDKTPFRDYVGVVVETATPLWKIGQVKFELKTKSTDLYEGFFYSKSHAMSYRTSVALRAGILADTWFKTELESKINYSLNSGQEAHFSVEGDIAYLRVPSFSGDLFDRLNSLYETASPAIYETPYLIIDVRNNGGGDDGNARPLVDYFYSDPIKVTESVEFYATEAITKLYEDTLAELLQDPAGVGPETISTVEEAVVDLKNAKRGSFVAHGENQYVIEAEEHGFPQRVAILYNRGCASACETLLFWAKESNKTILVGERSGGFVGYGNTFTTYTPAWRFGLTTTTSRYKDALKYEVVGIRPDVELSYAEDWVSQTKQVLRDLK